MFKTLAAWVVLFAVFSAGPALRAQDDDSPEDAAETLGAQAFEILDKNCVQCHGALKMAGLDLRTRDGMTAGGDRGRALVPGDPERSLLFQFATHQAEPNMPPGKKLSERELAVLRRWISDGASLEGVLEANNEGPDSEQDKADLAKLEERPITSEERAFWAYQAPQKVDPPQVSRPEWSKNPIDAFVLAKLEEEGLTPSPRVDRRGLIRRAYLDVLGLLPSPEEVEAFVNDDSPDAWPRLVDRLLASPHYGERWARHWLDLARYADSGGFEFDRDRDDAWRFRDYVVRALNEDKPYDQFIREQLAGDEFYPDSDDAMIATGFMRLGPGGGGGGERGLQEKLDDIVGTTTLTFLGQTVSCARCHNHKFDPIPQKDYYRIQAVFYNTRQTSHPLAPTDVVQAYEEEAKRLRGLQRSLRDQLAKLEKPYRDQLVEEWISRLPEYMQVAWRTPEEDRTEGQKLNVRQIERTLYSDQLSGRITEEQVLALMPEEEQRRHAEIREQIDVLDDQRPEPYAQAEAVTDRGPDPRPSYFLHRGSYESKGSVMAPGILSVVAENEWEFPTPPPDAKTTWRRRGFADWVASPENPLTSRVMVNRIWQHHFGEGIVRTPSNFGTTGERPTHPELLDWLAVEFVENGWSLKHMHRLMLNSEAYQMASDDIEANLAIDPLNFMLWRMPRQRLDAETIRDAILAAAGTLDRTLGGPGIFPYINPDLFQASSRRSWPGKPDADPATWRRSLYVFSKRSMRYPLFETFDQPNLVNSCDRRNRSTIAPQALLMMNNSFVREHAARFADRIRKEAGADREAQIDRAWLLALGRPPRSDERERALAFVEESSEGLMGLCQGLVNLNEFVYRQ